MWSASPCSSTTTARRRTARAPAARPGHPRRARVAERIGIPHYVLDYESRFREAVIDDFADKLYRTARRRCPASTATVDQVPRPAGHRARTRRRGAGHRPLCRFASACRRRRARSTAPARRSATRAISCSPPRASSSSILRFPLGERGQAGDARARAPLRPRRRRQARQPGHLLRADRALHRRDRAA